MAVYEAPKTFSTSVGPVTAGWLNKPLVSVIFPTTGRKDMALAALKSLFATTQEYHLEVIAVVDADMDSADAIRSTFKGKVNIVDYSPNYRGCSKAWNDGLAQSTGDYIVLAADDLEFTDGWLDEALKVMDTLPDGGGLVGFNDDVWNGNELATHYLFSRQFIIDHMGGRLAWECYRHSFNDVETNERAKRANRYAWAEKAVVKHHHWTKGGREQDATDTRWLPEWQASSNAYEARRVAGFPNDYPPVIGTQDDAPLKKLRIGWLTDVSPYVGGAELAADELAACAPENVEIVSCKGLPYLPENVDAYVVHNCVNHDDSIIEALAKKPVFKVIHDVWPHGDAKLRRWLLDNSALLFFSSPLHVETFRYAFKAPHIVAPMIVNAPPFIEAAAQANERSGHVWAGRMYLNKGMANVCQWAAQKDVTVDFYGAGVGYDQITQPGRYRGAYEYKDLPAILAKYDTFVYLPEAFEPFSRVTVEAWLTGCNLVVSRNVGALHWIENEPEKLYNAGTNFWQTVTEKLYVPIPDSAQSAI